MGLVITHGAFEGGYIKFNRFRTGIIKAIGGSYPPHENPRLDMNKWYWRSDGETDENFNRTKYIGLYEFLCHSDCDGDINTAKVRALKTELESILPLIEDYAKSNDDNELMEMTNTFLKGCESAIKVNEPLEFY
ncbi:hypothetical protein [Vagococcus fluvialis]|uniref:hypothetical protein n=1 Tax=Vagococcus fluvialis TaxID=2738 RepID=UPI001D0A819E|nr:hypothetical protein [Vagococcus fluvialis]UDM70678.1 hypothetical protein K5L00_11180 [Vagococcus fluvialis]UDM78097.1 hypothetical protein K5K98_06715 [Vagococcus fluvialis]UDM82366.1 hypothetical protein K5K96_13655 [Vagococcus fluvialis]